MYFLHCFLVSILDYSSLLYWPARRIAVLFLEVKVFFEDTGEAMPLQ